MPIVLAIATFGDIAFVLVVAVVAVVGGIEITRMTRHWLPGSPLWYGVIPAAGLAFTAAFAFPATVGLQETLVVCWFVVWLISVVTASGDLRKSVAGVSITLASGIYLGTGAGHLILLRSPDLQSIFGEPEGYQYILLLLGLVWATDTAAFTVGRLVGRRALAPTISPRKTVEGAVGGLLAAAVLAAGLSSWIGLDLSSAVIAGLVVSGFAQLGDLAESLAKRAAAVKDSGTLFPGHGGMLDRVDSLIFAAPALYYVLILVGRGAS